MTHSEKRTHWFKEGAIGLGVGVLYGVTNTCVGHPWDTLKTKMQAQAGFEKSGMFQTFYKTLRTQGVVGLYRGCIPPLWGSGIYRSMQFAVFEGVPASNNSPIIQLDNETTASLRLIFRILKGGLIIKVLLYTYLDNQTMKYEIPGTAGLQLRVIVAGGVASTSRAIIETPLEFAKIRRQTQQSWELRKVYTGFGITWVRTMGLMTSYFILVDTGRRNFPEHFKRPILGPFLISGLAATFSWWLVWPFEYMKSQVQSGYGGKDIPVMKRMLAIIREKGFFSLYRGIMPGTIRSFLANGSSMVVMTYAQRKVSKLGLRD